MSFKTSLQQQWNQMTGLGRDAWLYLSMTIILSTVFSGWGLYFNFFILAQGHARSWLGIFSGASPAAALLLGVAMGLFSDKIGKKKAMFIGILIYLLGLLVAATNRNPYVILTALFLGGAGNTMVVVNQLPLLSRLGGKESKSFIFSMNFALMTFSGMLGNLVAGNLPALYSNWFGLAEKSIENYQAIMLTSVGFAFFAFIPLILLQLPKDQEPANTTEKQTKKQDLIQVFRQPLTWKIFAPNFLIGMGAALLVPFFNLYLVDKFAMTELGLGRLFSIAGLLTGIGTLLSPTLEKLLGSRIKAIALAQGSSLFFLMILGFSPTLWLAIIGFLMRGALMNMGVPLWDSFAMDQVPEEHQATISSLLFVAWEIGWAVGPTISGIVQEQYGFPPLFIATGILYASAIAITWYFFSKTEDLLPSPILQPSGD